MTRIGSDVGVPKLEPEVFDRAIVAVALTAGADHRLMYYNDAFRALFGPRDLGERAVDVFTEPNATTRFVKMLDEVFRNRAAQQVTDPRTTEGTAPGAPGRRHFVYSCSPVVSRYGPGVLAVAVDATPQIEAIEATQRLSEQRQDTLRRYEALMSAVSQIVWLMRPDGEVEELVGDFSELTGRSRSPLGNGQWIESVHPHDRSRLVRAWKDASEGVPSVFVCTFRLEVASGEFRHVQTRAVPVVHGEELVEWIGATSDVEDQWRNRLRERLLARVATVTAAADVPDAFAAVTAAVVPDLTDACAVFLLPPPGLAPPGAPLTAVRVASVARRGLPDMPPKRDRPYTVGPIAQQVIDSRHPKVLVFPAGEPPPGALSEMSRRWLRTARATSLTMVPIIIDAEVAAFACAAGCADSPPPGTADLALLGEILHEVREPLRQAVVLQRTRHTALTLQRALLTATPRVEGAELAAQYQPASKTAEIGGDWYDSLLLPDGTVTLTIGDIAGHDLEAATSMSQLRSMLRVIAYDQPSREAPANSLSQLDRVADGLAIAPLVTMVHANLVPEPDGRWHVFWSNAGHPPPLLLPARGEPRYLHGGGPDLPLCVSPSTTRATWHHVLESGDVLLLYTDGLIEVPGTDLGEGLAALARIADSARSEGLTLAEICSRLMSGVGDRRDDAAIIGFRPTVHADGGGEAEGADDGGSPGRQWSGAVLG